jgi:large subunit ribosomal protein L21
MYAIIETGGKQYRVSENDTITVEKLDAQPGATLTLDKVMLVADGDKLNFGAPLVAGAKVEARVILQDRAQKIRVFRYKKRKGYRKTIGHRQYVSVLKITKISL